MDFGSYKPLCMNLFFTGRGDWNPGSSEDCLYLNIYAPKDGIGNGKYPVVIYFHGGSYFFGSNNFRDMHGTDAVFYWTYPLLYHKFGNIVTLP